MYLSYCNPWKIGISQYSYLHTYHMGQNRNWFNSFRNYNSGIVFLGDNWKWDVVWVGEIKFKMHDGIIRTLKYIGYILELNKNLISLGQLDIYGLTYKAEGGILNIKKGSIVVMKTEEGMGCMSLWETHILLEMDMHAL